MSLYRQRRFYMPDSMAKELATDKFEIAPGAIVAVGPVNIPAYQDRPQIVTRNKDGTLNFAQFDRWGERLDAALARMVSEDLAAMLPATTIQLFPCNFNIPLNYQIIVDVFRLDGELEKELVLTAQWTIVDAKNRKMLLTKRAQFIQPINPHNYFGLSRALSAVTVSLAKEIARDLSTLSRKPETSQ